MNTLLNVLIFSLTLILTIRFFRKDGIWHIKNGAVAFRYFTVLSNVLCALAALCMCEDEVRLPLVPMQERNRPRLYQAMRELGLPGLKV